MQVSQAERLLRRIEWTAFRRLDGLLQGDYRTLFRGAGVDLIDLREYQPHDDVRHIDWNVTARLQVPHVRQYAEEREMSAWFLIDLTPSTGFGSVGRSKRDAILEFVLLLARLIVARGNRVGALVYGRGIDALVPPGAGRRHVLSLAHRLLSMPQLGVVGPTRLALPLERLGAMMRRRSTLFVVSDFLSEPGWELPLGRLAQRHDVLAVWVRDPLEAQLPAVGLMTFTDPETGETLFVDSTDPALRRRYGAIAEREGQRIEAVFARTGVPRLRLSTERDVVTDLLDYLLERRALRHLAAAPGARAGPRSDEPTPSHAEISR
ncbi:MAG: DUF58 domain-containing protein [Casimicrobiaceae bacterium]|nr:DUF58 domain-containing protein [Casimicrobiaceae bacterium]